MKTNKGIVMGIFLLIAIFMTSIAVSATLDVTGTYDENNPTFGDENQEASNPEHDTDSKQDQFAEAIITLDNSGLVNINTFTIDSFTPNGFNLAKADFVITTQSPINAGDTGTITVKAKIPEDLDAVNADFEKVAFLVGTLTIMGNNGDTASLTVYMQRENKLSIKDLDALVDEKDTQNNLEDGDEIKDLRPGASVDMTLKVESTYETRAKIDVEDVELNIVCENDEDIDFVDDNIDFGNIGPGDEDEDTIAFSIEQDAKEDTANCDFTLEGTDENGARHGQKINIDISINRNSHDIVIDSVSLSPSALTCSDNAFQVVVDLINLGTRDEDKASVQIQSINLNINEKVSNLDIEEDDSLTETFVVNVDPNSLDEGKYAILVSTFYDNTRQTDSKVVQIDNFCNTLVGSDNTDNTEDNVVEPFTNSITLDQSQLSAVKGKQTSIKVQLTNKDNSPIDYTVGLENLGDFAASGSSNTVHLNPGQTSTVFLNFKVNSDAEEGMYTASVVLKDAKSNSVLETETFTVEVQSKTSTSTPIFSGLDFGGESKVLLIVANVVLVIIAIFLIRLIFSSGKKRRKTTEKKLADFEPDHSVVMNRKKK